MRSDIHERERALLETEKQRAPHLFERPPLIDSPQELSWIGIEGVFEEFPVGYIKYLPQDFIVEEISLEKSLHTVEEGNLWKQGEKISPLQAELVKMDCSTLGAKDELALHLGVPSSAIGFAGIKDHFALTSQAISIQGVAEPALIAKIKNERWFLKNVEEKKGMLKSGDLWGNRFLIAIRTPQEISSAEQDRIRTHLQEITEQGFWNFFSFQRFGTPRLNSHIAGRFLLNGDYEGTVKSFFLFRSHREIPYIGSMREGMETEWGNWELIRDMIKEFPSYFPSEIAIVNHLCQHPDDFLGALRTIPDQVRLWVYAYASYLFNRKLSMHIQNGEVPLKLPLITSPLKYDWDPYEQFLKEDGVKLPSRIPRDFPFIFFTPRTISTLQSVEVHDMRFQGKIATTSFSLPKGAYATTFLAHIFQLASNLPILPGIDTTSVDVKKILGLGSLEETLEYFQPVLSRLSEDRTGE